MRMYKNPLTSWAMTKAEIKRDSTRVNLHNLAAALRGSVPLPREVRDYLADAIDDGRLKHKGRGRPYTSTFLDDWVTAGLLDVYEEQLYLARNSGSKAQHGTPHEIAVAKTAKKYNMSDANVKRLIGELKLAKGINPGDFLSPRDPFWEPT